MQSREPGQNGASTHEHPNGNGVHDHGNGAHDHGNGAHDHGNGAYDHGNGAYDHGNGVALRGDALADAPSPALDEAKRLVGLARAAQWYWRQEPLDTRVDALRRAARTMLRRRDEVIALARREMGKVPAEGLFIEALGPLDTVNGWAAVVRDAASRRRVWLNPIAFARKSAYVDHVARGVVGVIAPWNFPAAGLYRAVFPALMTGNAVVLKPSEHTPKTSAWVIERLAEELPSGLVHVLQGDGKAGAALVDSGIDACVFTGSVRHGGAVRVRCAERGIPSSIEMGGKDGAIVLHDCDLSRTVAGVTHWALCNAGQACGAIEVAYVERTIADAFVEALRGAWTSLGSASIAPLGNRHQLDVVRGQVEDARARGAIVVCGGQASGDGLEYPPTILDRCDERMAVVQEETFGPVLAVVRIDGVMEAVRAINRSPYGLGASIWSRDVARARRIAERLEVGVVNVNNHAFSGSIPSLPWSGTRATGFGVANGAESLHTFVRPRTTTIDESSGPDLYWMPYDDALLATGEAVADAQIGHFSDAWRLPLLVRGRLKTIRTFFRFPKR
jgi:acyl-CoA reductase-like NAD-dependent aldehyde dehydrogenase